MTVKGCAAPARGVRELSDGPDTYARARQPRALTSDQAATACTMRKGGIDLTTIAATLGVSRATIYCYTDPAEAAV